MLGDVETVHSYLSALAETPEILGPYPVLSREATPIAADAGRDPARLEEVRCAPDER